MARKVRIGITRDLFDKEGKFYTPGPGLKLLEAMPNVEWAMFSQFVPDMTPEQIKGSDMVITLRPKWTEKSFASDSQLLSVHRSGVGYDEVNVPDLTRAGVLLCNTPKSVRRPLATAIICFILALSLRLPQKDRIAREGRWTDRTNYMGVGLMGKTLGSIGVGGIGHEMFRLAGPLGMKHLACDPYVKPEAVTDIKVTLVDMDTILREADFLSISCPLNEKTRHLIGEKELRKMKKTAFLINTSRGPVVDEAALITALKESWIQGAAIDVFEQEPTPATNPLLKMENVIVTPHAIGWTDEVWAGKWEENLTQISQIIRGEMPESLVNNEAWNSPAFQARLKKFRKETGG